jgi:inorganic pyrophosphatase
MVNEATFSDCLIEARMLGLFRMRDRGVEDCKLLGVPNSDPLFEQTRDLDDVPRHFLREVEHFFSTYKQLEGVTIEVGGWSPQAEAIREVRDSVLRYESEGPRDPEA